MTTVEKIHNEIDTAQERLLFEARELINNISLNIIDKDKLIISKAERLEKIGFKESEEVKKAETIKKVLENNKNIIIKSEQQAELLEYYSKTYPFHKFLTIDELDRICKKYKLVYAPVNKYKKSVPEKNLQDIENGKKLLDCDKQDFITRVYYKVYNWYNKKYKNEYIIPKETKNWENPIITNKIFVNKFEFERYLENLYNTSKEVYISDEDIKIEKINRTGYFIAAPKSHFNLKDLKENGLGFFKIEIPKDPIVFQYCRGDIIRIETKWGLESEDNNLVLPINN